MNPLRVFVRNHPVLTYFALTFAISWGGVILVVGGSNGMSGTGPTDDPRFVYALVAMLAGPSISGILLTALVGGRKGLRDLRWRALPQWTYVMVPDASGRRASLSGSVDVGFGILPAARHPSWAN